MGTSINTALAATPPVAQKSDSTASSAKSDIASLSNLTLDQVETLADKTFSALGKDGIKFLPFLTALVNAFKEPGGTGAGGAAGGKAPAAGGGGKADVGASTQALLAFRNANPNVKDLDQILGSISKALPNLSQADFDSLLANLKTASAGAQPTAGSLPGQGKAEIDKFEMGLLEAQLAAAVGKGSSAAASPTGNKILDTVLSAIADIAKDGVTPEESKSLTGILADTASALLGPEKAAGVLEKLGVPSASGQGNSLEINVTATQGVGGSNAQPAAQRGGSQLFDPGRNLDNFFERAGAESNFNPNNTYGLIGLWNRQSNAMIAAAKPSGGADDNNKPSAV